VPRAASSAQNVGDKIGESIASTPAGFGGAPSHFKSKNEQPHTCAACTLHFHIEQYVCSYSCNHVVHMYCHIKESYAAWTSTRPKQCPVGKDSCAPDGTNNPIVYTWWWNRPAPAGAVDTMNDAVLKAATPYWRPTAVTHPSDVPGLPLPNLQDVDPNYNDHDKAGFYKKLDDAGFITGPRMSITQCVQDSGTLPRADICRYLFLSQRDTHYTHSLWSLMKDRKPWIQIPKNIWCDRSFLRDVHECLWAMVSGDFADDESKLKPNPYSKVEPWGHWYEMPANRDDLIYESYLQRESGLYLTLDDPDCTTNTLEVNQRFFPRVEQWVKALEIPPALCIPVSYTRFVYGTELAHGTNYDRRAQLQKAAREETFQLLVKQWFRALVDQQRMYILKKETIKEIDDHFRGRNPSFPGTRLSEILILMKQARETPASHTSSVAYFTPPMSSVSIPPSHYVPTKAGSNLGVISENSQDFRKTETIRFEANKLGRPLRAIHEQEMRTTSSSKEVRESTRNARRRSLLALKLDQAT